jgi:hypothetical protein
VLSVQVSAGPRRGSRWFVWMRGRVYDGCEVERTGESRREEKSRDLYIWCLVAVSLDSRKLVR